MGNTKDSGSVRRFRSQKAASLLAYLAFHRGQAVSREFLCDMLWPDEADGEITRNRFRVTLASLRRQLEPPGVPPGAVLESVGNHQVRLRAETVTTDVAAFEAAVRAGDGTRAAFLYRGGPLLPALYEEWIPAEQERLATIFARLGAETHREKAEPVSFVADAAPPPPAEIPPSRTVSVPLYLSRFFGRDAEREQIAALLENGQARLITLTGIGGMGKTRLAAESVRNDPHLHAFVPLADVWEAGQLGHVLRQALHLVPNPKGDAMEQVTKYLNEKPKVRLVLDNVEQIAQTIAPIIGRLLTDVPSLFLIVTSRRRLDIPGEREIPVAPLDLPAKGEGTEQIAGSPSVCLFLDRVQAVRPDYQITPRNAEDFSALCHLLDGVPLALELAAARAATLSPAQIHARLAERMESELSAGSRRLGKEERHRSMNVVVEWSYALLPPDLRRFFLLLCVFRGGWDIPAAEAVTGESDAALDYLSRLRGHSLITQDGVSERFRLLETLRSWADDHLTDLAVRAALFSRHADYFADMGEAAAHQAESGDELPALEKLEADEANLRAAFEYALSGGESSDAEMVLRIALILYALGRARGSLPETLRTLYRALAFVQKSDAQTSAGQIHARALLACGELTQLSRGIEPARPFLHAALPLARKSNQPDLTARTLRALADNALFGEEYDAALPLYEEALRIQRTTGNERGAAQTLNSLALLARRKNNDFAEAARLTRESGDYFRRVGDKRMLSYNLFNRGELALEQNEMEEAEPYFRESLALAQEMRDDWQCLYVLFALARTAGRRGQLAARRDLMREVLPLALRIGDVPVLVDALREQADLAKSDGDKRGAVTLLSAAHAIAQGKPVNSSDAAASAAVLSGLGERSFQAAWNRGAVLTPEQAVHLALAAAVPHESP